MPVSYQIVPEHVYPHQHVQINDNTEVPVTYASGSSDITALLCVFSSPKGRDNQIYTIDTGLAGFMKEYGLGPFALYGQPLLNAYAAAASQRCLVHCLRVTANDATYASTILMAKYKVDDTSGAMDLKLYTTEPENDLTNLADLPDILDVPTTEDGGYKVVPLLAVAYIGRGQYGNSLRWRITSDKTTDKNNDYKNYVVSVYTTDSGMQEQEQHHVSIIENSVYSGSSIYAPDVINDIDSGGSQLIKFHVNQDAVNAIWSAYKTGNPDTHLTLETFDPLLGIDKTTRGSIDNFTLEAESDNATTTNPAVALNSTTGVALSGGSDGSLDASVAAATRASTLKNLYTDAFNGKTDPYIKSKNRFPTTFILDANYPVEVKQLIASLCLVRKDCMAMLDCGTEILTKSAVRPYINTNLAPYLNDRVHTIEPWCMKIRDPYTMKSVTVTSTYWLAGRYPQHIYEFGGKHKPLAGNRYGVVSGYLPNSVYPIFDEDLDSEEMDNLAEMHVNFAKYNANQEICRAMQDTRQSKQTVLSEQNNMLIVLDIKRDAERLSAQFEYDFSEAEDLARFNTAMQVLVDKYAAAQVRSITAAYSKNEWESVRNYIHLNIALVCKDLVRTTIIEIDVNRS